MNEREAAEARIRAALQAPPADPVDGTREFLRAFVSDALSVQEAVDDAARLAAANPRSVVRGLVAIEAVVSDPPAEGTLAQLVAVDANRDLDDPSDTGARAWLVDLAARIREALGDDAPPPPG